MKRSSSTLSERFMTALYKKNYKILSCYLNAATVNLRTESDGRTLLMLAVCASDADVEMVQFLIEKGADVNLRDTVGQYTALHLAACSLRKDIVQVLLKAGADPNATDKSGWTPLHHIVAAPDPRFFLIRELVEHGADPEQKAGTWKSAIELATETGRQELFRGSEQRKRQPRRRT